MMPPEKDHTSIGYEEPTLDASNSPTNRDTARQEFKQEADINYLLSRFGLTQPRGAPTYGIWDDTIDLQQALQAVRDARAGYNELPANLRAKFNSMEELLRAVENGSLVLKDEEAPEPVKSQMDILQERLAAAEKRLNEAAATT